MLFSSPSRRLLTALAACLACCAVAAAADENEALPPIRGIQLAAGKPPAGAGVTMPLAEFEATLRKAEATLRRRQEPAAMQEARYAARLEDDALAGEGSWRFVPAQAPAAAR